MRKNRVMVGMLSVLMTLVVVGSVTWGAQLILKDGTILKGTVIRQGENYWIKMADGTSKIVPPSNVAKFIPDDPNSGGLTVSGSSAAFTDAKARADRVLQAIQAVAIWQEFVDKYPTAPEAKDAKAELAKWKDLSDQNAEKINGKWVGGDDLKKIVADAKRLTDEGVADFAGANRQTLKAKDLLTQAIRIYPNNFVALFVLGDIAMFENKYTDAARFYQLSSNVFPNKPEPYNNMGVANFFAHNYESAIQNFYKALKVQDSRIPVQNIVNSLDQAPNLRRDPKNKAMLDDVYLLAQKYGVSNPTREMTFMVVPREGTGAEDESKPTVAWGGTGFFIDSEGLIITNHHVATGHDPETKIDAKKIKTTLMIVIGQKQVTAEVVAIDDEFDLALLRARNQSHTPYVRLAKDDLAHEGAVCTVMGFPQAFLIGTDLKVTSGIISSTGKDHGFGADTLVDAKVNHGNSGGPILDKYGNVIAVVSLKTEIGNEESYGIGISAGNVKKFLKRNHIDPLIGDTTTPMSVEAIVTKVKPATVFILGTQTGSMANENSQ